MTFITSSLLSIGLNILGDLAAEPVRKLLASRKDDLEKLNDLFIRSFFKALDDHEKSYDDAAKKIVKRVRETVKKDELKLLSVISRQSEDDTHFFASIKRRDVQIMLANEIVKEYGLDISRKDNIIRDVLGDCFSYYRNAFFNLMTETEGIQLILKECLKIDDVLDILNRIDKQKVSRSEFDELKSIAYRDYFNRKPDAQKKLEDYDKYIMNKFRYVELRGFSPKVSGKEIQMGLSEIFVPLEMTANKYASTEDQDVESKSAEEPSKVEKIIQVLFAKNIVILGDPGSGKSTLLKYLTVKAPTYRNTDHPFGCIIPLYFRISEFAIYLKNNGKNLYEFITDYFDKQYGHLYKEGFEYSNLLLFMDGMDEVVDTSLRIRVTEQVEDLMARYPYNHYVVTSRIVGYQESRLGAGFKHFELKAFGEEEIKMFSMQWYRAIAENTDKDYVHAEEQAKTLSDSISRNPSVMRLGSNPLLMTIIALIHYRGKQLPNKRIELYDISSETFLEHWVNNRRRLELAKDSQLKDKDEIIEIMAPVAFEIHETKSNGLIGEKEFKEVFLRIYKSVYTNAADEKAKLEYKAFFNFLRQEAGFFYEKGEDETGQPLFGFIHLTFEEYFAAIHFMGQWMDGAIDLKKYVFDPRWVEIIRLASSQIRVALKGNIGRSQASRFVKELLSVEDVFPEAYIPLQLVCLVLSDDVDITDELQNEILDKIVEALSKTENYFLTDSFLRLFKELLYSDKKEVLFERFKRELVSTPNPILRKNVVDILMKNSGEKSICEFLSQLLMKPEENKEICNLVFSMRWNEYPIQKLNTFRESFRLYLKSLSIKENKEIVEKLVESFLTIAIKQYWFDWDYINPEILEDILDYFYGAPVFEPLLIALFQTLLRSILSSPIIRSKFEPLLKKEKYRSVPLVSNFSNLMDQIYEFIKEDEMKMSSSPFYLSNFNGILFFDRFSDKTIIQFWYWSKDFTELMRRNLVSEKKSFDDGAMTDFLNRLRTDFPDHDIDRIEMEIYSTLGPQRDKQTDVDRFIRASHLGMSYGEGLFPYTHISYNPEELSKIIAEKGWIYLILGAAPDAFTLDAFYHEDVCPPARLVAHLLLKKPYDPQLLTDCIEYYRTCPPDEKNGVFDIIYKVYNKLG